MARYLGPKCKLSRREGVDLFLKSAARPIESKCNLERPPGQHGARRPRLSDYGLQLREKQKVKRLYGLLEKQFSNLMAEASRTPGQSGATLLQYLERRLDNAVYRAGFAPSRRAARQLVTHGHFMLNGRRVDIPSIRVKAGDVITVRSKSTKSGYFTAINEVVGNTSQVPLSWLKSDVKKLKIDITGVPTRDEAEADINEQLIVEYYSR